MSTVAGDPDVTPDEEDDSEELDELDSSGAPAEYQNEPEEDGA